MKTYLSIFLLGIIALSYVSCAKTATDNTGGNNSPTVDTSYQPSSAGSSWLYYTRDTAGNLKDSIKVTSTGRDTSINSNSYVILNYDTTLQFQSHNANKYAFRTSAYSFNTTYGNISVKGINVIYINNETDAVGTNWTFSCIDGNNVTVPSLPVHISTQAVGTVKGVGLTDTENGVTYNKVFFSHIAFQANLVSWQNIAAMDIYAARGVGIIKIITYDQNGVVSTIQSLKSYTIK